MHTMMPLAPTPIVPVPTKPKIGFSIDSIVGGAQDDRLERLHERGIGSPTEIDGSTSPKLVRRVTHSPGIHSENSDRPHSRSSSVESYLITRHNSHNQVNNNNNNQQNNNNNHQQNINQITGRYDFTTAQSHSSCSTPNNSPSPPHRNSHIESPSNNHIIQTSSGIVRPSPNYLAPPPQSVATAAAVAAEQIKSIYGIPGHQITSQQGQNEYHTQQFALAANLAAAQHFQASNLAVALQAHHGTSHVTQHGPYGHPGGGPGGAHPQGHPHQTPRDSYPLFPWLLSRHGRLFPHRFPAGPDIPGFLLQPFRKPKRIRTAFSPSQLLKLEHAFEKNHYVVGAERKQLAQALSLTETQVKVWFQNRRTKHKRVQQEEETKAQQQSGGGNNPNSNGNKNTHHVSKWQQETGDYHRDDDEDDETEMIDQKGEDCSSSSES
ncbi:hypothetical protein HCN44_004736 [Aphidius gifuensis]|uniref:Homeobox domain-containing protein n=1 Tax=Aphidius gifuensis TaxID=684658 RepID=A0A835CSR2_APHGI|nr:homeotic protein empty spiracles-like [Aphidius gifuensis]KAF7995264.1 hypothetical protein HCN44_004736 [Aphidius gifuensis]